MTALFDDPEASKPKLPADVIVFVDACEAIIGSGRNVIAANALKLCAIVRALFDEHVKDADRVKRYGDAYSYWLSRAAENDAKFVDARNKLIDETAQRELVEAERDALRERVAKLEATLSNVRELSASCPYPGTLWGKIVEHCDKVLDALEPQTTT